MARAVVPSQYCPRPVHNIPDGMDYTLFFNAAVRHSINIFDNIKCFSPSALGNDVSQELLAKMRDEIQSGACRIKVSDESYSLSKIKDEPGVLVRTNVLRLVPEGLQEQRLVKRVRLMVDHRLSPPEAALHPVERFPTIEESAVNEWPNPRPRLTELFEHMNPPTLDNQLSSEIGHTPVPAFLTEMFLALAFRYDTGLASAA